ncbi:MULTISPECIES: hypothetical protein [unclassified Rhizobium]|uniref:hypothetical protein n=1 Tax=unclassified Rhizobium TaxID=2613769 RepID=UPI001ADC7D44|nr:MULTISPECIES: hypothetical protein [unclassified Rhizobium]MBO9127932.1 hypothetical protein [Rhizobium sp. 16-488-2b]MBO9178509.1 hypothetical protein [Rhizobium sp. 16-488-2a]
MQYDEIMEGLLSHQETPTVDRFGGLDRLLSDGARVGASMFSDIIVEMVLPFRDERPADVDEFLADILIVIDRGPELNTISNRMLALHFDDPAVETKVFKRLLGTAIDCGRPTVLRNAALKGALAFAREDAIRLARLVADLSEVSPNDEPTFLAHAARIAGVLHGKTRNAALSNFLHVLGNVSDVADQVQFELGLLSLQQAIEAEDTATVLLHLTDARQAFDRAVTLRDSRHDARSYQLAIDLLMQFHRRQIPENIEVRLKELRATAFAYSSYSLMSRSDPILGSIASQVAALTSLAGSLATLTSRLDEDVWLEAVEIIEEHLLFAYEANQSVFAGRPGRGVDCVIRPTLEPRLFGNRNHVQQLSAWLRRHASKFDAELTGDLARAVEAAYSGGADFPTVAEPRYPLDSALRERVRSTSQLAYEDLVATALKSLHVHQSENAGIAVRRMLETVDSDFATVEDYASAVVRGHFLALVLGVANFLAQKLDSSVELDRFSEYLFERGKPLPHEKDLQQDFLRHARSAGLPVSDERRGIAGGRADVVYTADGVAIVIEVKRELVDASFSNLLASYGEQTVIYQATNVKLGVMLVLDLSKKNSRLAHMDTWYETRIGDLLNDGTERAVLIVKVPGRRETPSTATKASKAEQGKRRIVDR